MGVEADFEEQGKWTVQGNDTDMLSIMNYDQCLTYDIVVAKHKFYTGSFFSRTWVAIVSCAMC